MATPLELMLSVDGVRLLHESNESADQVLGNIEAVTLDYERLPLWEIEQLMRRDLLYAVQHPEWDKDDSVLFDDSIMDKYIWRYQRTDPKSPGTFTMPDGTEGVRREYPEHIWRAPGGEVDEEGRPAIQYEWLTEIYRRAETWAKAQLGEFHTWIGDDDLGKERRFIDEGTRGLEVAFGQLGALVRYNVRMQMPEIRHNDGTWHPFNDRLESGLRQTIAAVFSFARRSHNSDQVRAVPADWSNAKWHNVFNAMLFNVEVDPFVLWLGTLPEWDGQPRIDRWLRMAGFEFEDFAGADALIEWSARSILMVACARALRPGEKHDTIPVLVGPQGCGKSTALAWLIPEHARTQWFNDGLRLSADEKRRVEALQGAVIVEVAEMTGATTADIESLKAFLSRTNDFMRLSFRHNPEAHPRMCSIAGTANGTAILPNDPSGNRRFVALRIVAGSVERVREYLDRHRDQMWAEAWSRVRSGEPCYFPAELEPAQSETNEQHRSSDAILEDAVKDWLDNRPSAGEAAEWFRVRDVAKGAHMVRERDNVEQLSQRDVQRLTRVLDRLGCKPDRLRINGVRTRVWRYPE